MLDSKRIAPIALVLALAASFALAQDAPAPAPPPAAPVAAPAPAPPAACPEGAFVPTKDGKLARCVGGQYRLVDTNAMDAALVKAATPSSPWTPFIAGLCLLGVVLAAAYQATGRIAALKGWGTYLGLALCIVGAVVVTAIQLEAGTPPLVVLAQAGVIVGGGGVVSGVAGVRRAVGEVEKHVKAATPKAGG